MTTLDGTPSLSNIGSCWGSLSAFTMLAREREQENLQFAKHEKETEDLRGGISPVRWTTSLNHSPIG